MKYLPTAEVKRDVNNTKRIIVNIQGEEASIPCYT